MEDAWCQDEAFLETADLVLKLPTGQELLAARQFLTMASPVIRDALGCGTASGAKRPREELQVSGSSGLPYLRVEGSCKGWSTLLRFIHQPVLSDEPVKMTPAAAFQVLPIAHQYNMQALMRRCAKEVQHASLPLAAHSALHLDGAEPNLLQWLALADSKQYAPLIQACLEQLGNTDGGGPPVMRSTLANPQARAHLEQLCSDASSSTLMELFNVFAGLPAGFKGIHVPDPTTTQPSCRLQLGLVELDSPYPAFSGRLSACGTMLVMAPFNSSCIQVVPLQANETADIIHFDEHNEAPSIVRAVDAASCSGKQMALSGGDWGTMRLWELSADIQCLRDTFTDEEGADIASVCFCGEHQAASGAAGGVVRVCDLHSGTAVHSDLRAHRTSVWGLKAAKEGALLLSASADKTAKLWDLRSGSCVRTLEGHKEAVRTVDMDDQGSTAVSGSHDNTLRIWDLGSGRCTATLSEPKGSVCSVHMDGGGMVAVSASSADADSELLVWDLSRAKLCSRHAFSGSSLHGIYASRDLSILATLQEFLRETHIGPDLEYVVKVWSA